MGAGKVEELKGVIGDKELRLSIYMKLYKSIILRVMLITGFAMSIPSNSVAGQKAILFDEGHGQRFLTGKNGPLDLSGLSNIFQKEGVEVRTSNGVITDQALSAVAALVISGAFIPFAPSEITAIQNFINRGGRLCVMLHIGFPVASLLQELNVYVSNGVVHEQENILEHKTLDFSVVTSGQHQLTRGIAQFKVFGGWALFSGSDHAEKIAITSNKAWIDLNKNHKRDAEEQKQSLALALVGKLGAGSFVVFGDDAIFQNRFLSGENMMLARNLAKWLGAGSVDSPPVKAFL